MVLGYVKKIFRAKLNDENKLEFDKFNHPIFRPNKELGVLHQENGFWVAYKNKKDPEAEWEMIKTISVPRGINCNVNAEYIPEEHKMEMDALETELPFGVHVTPRGANVDHGNDFKLRNYEQHFLVHEGGRDCDIGDDFYCKPSIEYEEYFRLDIHRHDNSDINFFHQGRSIVHKVSDHTVPMWDDYDYQ